MLRFPQFLKEFYHLILKTIGKYEDVKKHKKIPKQNYHKRRRTHQITLQQYFINLLLYINSDLVFFNWSVSVSDLCLNTVNENLSDLEDDHDFWRCDVVLGT